MTGQLEADFVADQIPLTFECAKDQRCMLGMLMRACSRYPQLQPVFQPFKKWIHAYPWDIARVEIVRSGQLRFSVRKNAKDVSVLHWQ